MSKKVKHYFSSFDMKKVFFVFILPFKQMRCERITSSRNMKNVPFYKKKGFKFQQNSEISILILLFIYLTSSKESNFKFSKPDLN